MLGILRIAMGLGLIGGVVWTGLAVVSAWAVLPLAALFTICFGLGRWRAWHMAAANGQLFKAVLGQGATFLVQCGLVGLFYLAGRGLAAIVGPIGLPFEPQLSFWVFAATASLVGATIVMLEAMGPGDPMQRAAADIAAAKGTQTTEPIGRQTNEETETWLPVTEDTFHQGWYFRHVQTAPNTDPNAEPRRWLLPDARLSEAQIAEHEARLGVALPPVLRRLYLQQNGSSGMCVAIQTDQPYFDTYRGRVAPFPGDSDLLPLDEVWPLRKMLDTDTDRPHADAFKAQMSRILVLAQWYGQMFVLDYRAGSAPRVGLLDLEHHVLEEGGKWEGAALWWDDFDSFFAKLERNIDDVDLSEDLARAPGG